MRAGFAFHALRTQGVPPCTPCLARRRIDAGRFWADAAAQGADKPAPAAKDLFNGKTLEGWKVTDFGGEGKVVVRDGTIVMERGNQMTGITWTGKPPRSNYELTLEGKRIEGSDFFCTTTFPVGDNYCSFVTGGWGGSVIGLSNVDHMDASENQTSASREFKNGTWYQFRIRVTDEKIEVWIDKDQVSIRAARTIPSACGSSATPAARWASPPTTRSAPCGTFG